MGDIAQILGGTRAKGGGFQNSQRPAPGGPPATHNPSKAMQITGMSREVMHLLSGNQEMKSAALPPIVPAFNNFNNGGATTPAIGEGKEVKVKVGNKWISSSKAARQWTWAPFASSSRTDGAMFRHWVRANVEYTDYPYAKFDIHLDPVTFSDEEYANYLKSMDNSWTKSETDKLMELARRFELRWPIIHDRWFDHYHAQEDSASPTSPAATRKVEDLQKRYYEVAAILSQMRISQEAGAEAKVLSVAVLPDPSTEDAKEKTETLLLESAAARALATSNPKSQPLINNVGTGSSNKLFDFTFERERRAHLDRLWKRSKAEELEEIELRKELKVIDAQLRKLKKTGGHILAAARGPSGVALGPNRLSSAASSRNPSRSVSPVPVVGANIADSPAILDQSFASTAPTPMPQTPYLQSGRLVPPATGGSTGLNKSLLTKMDQVLSELKIPAKPIPTKRVCDMYDTARKDILTLLTLQKMVMQKEGSLQAKRVKLSKLGGTERVLDEEALLGIAPPPAPPAPAPVTTSSKSRAARPSKPKSANAAGSKSKASTSKASTSKASAASKAKTTDDATKSDAKDGTSGVTKKAKTAAKRKRKPDAKNPQVAAPAPGAPPAAPKPVPAPVVVLSAAAAPPTAKPAAKQGGAAETTGAEKDIKQPGGKKRVRKS